MRKHSDELQKRNIRKLTNPDVIDEKESLEDNSKNIELKEGKDLENSKEKPKVNKKEKDKESQETKEEEYKVPYPIKVNNQQRIIRNQDLDKKYLSNEICTSKYTYVTAVPKILFEQFSQIGNIYFLALAVLQMIPQISQSNGLPTILIPLIFVVCVNGFKDFFEDYKRKKSDQRENDEKTTLLGIKVHRRIEWKNIKPGDIVKVEKDNYFPADLLLVYSSNKNGVAFVETKNLDGETNLKYKESVKELYKSYMSVKENKLDPTEDRTIIGTNNLDLIIENQLPFANMYEYNATCQVMNKVNNKKVFNSRQSLQEDGFGNSNNVNLMLRKTQTRVNTSNPVMNSKLLSKGLEGFNTLDKKNENVPLSLEYNNLLLRGSRLRNTDFIIGIVIYAGHNSKIMLNSLNARSKRSTVTKLMSKLLIFVVVFQVFICLLFSILTVVIQNNYAFIKELGKSNFIFSFFSWVLGINNLVPISLLVTMEILKYFQAWYISNDIQIYDRENRRPTLVQSSGLNEELGQVHYIFTDKTGTLTKNVMQFKYMIIGQKTYGSEDHIDKTLLKSKELTNVDFVDKQFWEDYEGGSDESQKEFIDKYVEALSLCHTVIPEEDQKNPGKIIFNASSPDELALVNAAKLFGLNFVERTPDNDVIIINKGNKLSYKLLSIFEFSSDRKRMSVVVKNQKTGKIFIITKGADSMLKPLLRKTEPEMLEYYDAQLERFGGVGLRTLLVASREVKEEEYKQYSQKNREILSVKDPKEKSRLLDQSYSLLENQLNLLGATAIEDCLQDNLPETLSAFRQIGIKVFMLTGDHPYTAISIAHSSGLMKQSDEAIICDTQKPNEINQKLTECIDKSKKADTCFVVTGNALIEILKDNPSSQNLKNLLQFAIVGTKCVICSRVSPKQKADIVSLVKNLDTKKICLAIGDGANDVNMITVADIGIGIFGNEGQQAARASDYSIGQFSFLKKLLFVYGRESYRKNTFAICYVLWKNFLYVIPIISFGFHNYFTGQICYDPFVDTFYNILYTAYNVGWYAIADRETSFEKMMKNPKRYRKGMKNKYFNVWNIIKWYIYAIVTGLFIYWVHYFAFYKLTNVEKDGKNYYSYDYDLWIVGTSMYTCIVIVVNAKIIFESNIQTVYTAILIIFSIGTYFLTLIIGNYISSLQIYKVFFKLFKSVNFWASLALILLVYFCIEYGFRSLTTMILKEKKRIKKKKLLKKLLKQKKLEQDISEKGFSIKILKSQTLFGRPSLGYKGYAFSEDVGNLSIVSDYPKFMRNHTINMSLTNNKNIKEEIKEEGDEDELDEFKKFGNKIEEIKEVEEFKKLGESNVNNINEEDCDDIEEEKDSDDKIIINIKEDHIK